MSNKIQRFFVLQEFIGIVFVRKDFELHVLGFQI